MSEPILEEWELIEQLVDSFASRHRAEDSVRWKVSMRQRVSSHSPQKKRSGRLPPTKQCCARWVADRMLTN